MDSLFDARGKCMSFMLTLKYSQYKPIIDAAYSKRGGIEGQRDVIKASTAIRIRKRMIDDIIQGTVLPPVVIGAVIGDLEYEEFSKKNSSELVTWLLDNSDSISLIDGMQRTTAMIAADSEKEGGLGEYELRVEIWLAKNINHLIYRMLILNSGQVPWDIKRQLQTVFSSVLKKIQADVENITIYTQDEGKRRNAPAQYQASDILELYLVFGSRKEKIDIKEKLSDEFVRLDFIDVTSSDDSGDLFCEALKLLGDLDSCFGRFQAAKKINQDDRFANGKDLFSSQPARVGFITASALHMLGRPGSTSNKQLIYTKWVEKRKLISDLLNKLNNLETNELGEFLALDALSEKLANKKVSKVGDYEREFFKTAFFTMYDIGSEIGNMEECWNSF